MINNLLEQLGFSKKEIDIYLIILKNGKIRVSDIAKVTGINRTTSYSVAEGLVKKGVVREDIGDSVRYLVALPPQELENLIIGERNALEKKEHTITEAISELKSFADHTSYSIPKIVFINKEDIQRYLQKNSEKWISSIMSRDGVWWGFQDDTILKYYSEWIDWFWTKTTATKKKLRLRLISNDSKIEKSFHKSRDYTSREVKFWKEAKNFTATTWVNGDFIVMIVTNQKPFYLVEIHDSVLAHNMREVFKGIWKGLK